MTAKGALLEITGNKSKVLWPIGKLNPIKIEEVILRLRTENERMKRLRSKVLVLDGEICN